MSEALYQRMQRLLERPDEPAQDPRIEALRQALVRRDAHAFAEHARRCAAHQFLPRGFLQKLGERHGLPLPPLTPEEPAPTPDTPAASLPKARQFANLLGSAARATHSVARTSLGIDRASDDQVEARLSVCRRCPEDHAVWKNGEVYTCGPMLESMKGTGQGTCGCILRKKARDLTEDCPFGWWPAP